MRTPLPLLALLLAAPTVAAQPAPPRAYVLADAGGGVLPNRLTVAGAERVQNAYGWTGAVEAGAVHGRTGLGLRVEAYRARRGDAADLQSLLPTSDWYDASQVNVLVVARREVSVGPLDLSTGSGAGVGYNVSYEQEAPTSATVRDGQVVSAVPTSREARVLPLLHFDATVGRRVGRTYVGLGVGTSAALGDHPAVRYGLQVQRRF